MGGDDGSANSIDFASNVKADIKLRDMSTACEDSTDSEYGHGDEGEEIDSCSDDSSTDCWQEEVDIGSDESVKDPSIADGIRAIAGSLTHLASLACPGDCVTTKSF